MAVTAPLVPWSYAALFAPDFDDNNRRLLDGALTRAGAAW
jgi:hypothetical protein